MSKDEHPNANPEFEIMFKESDAANSLPKLRAALDEINARSVYYSDTAEEKRKIQQEIALVEFEVERERFVYWQAVNPDRAEEHRLAMVEIAAKCPTLGLVADPDAVDKVAASVAVEADTPVIIPVPEGTEWDQVRIHIGNEQHIVIAHPGGSAAWTRNKLGFGKKRETWNLLVDLAKGDYVLKDNKANVHSLNTHLKKIFNISGQNPITFEQGKYVCRFVINYNSERLEFESKDETDCSTSARNWSDQGCAQSETRSKDDYYREVMNAESKPSWEEIKQMTSRFDD